MLAELELDTARERQRIIAFIREVLDRAQHTRVVLNLSGGLDSALVAALVTEAVGPENVLAMILPYETSHPQSEAHARQMVEQLGIACERMDITPMVRPLVERYPDMSAQRKGNIMARCRMIVLWDQSVRFRGLAAGTSNRTETLLGYFTLHGDAAAAFQPIGHLYKCQVRALARAVGVPEAIITKAPSADLWQGQTDEGELGFSYDEADQILFLLTEQHWSSQAIVARGFAQQTVEAVERRMHATAFKRQPPPVLSTVYQAVY